ncbi:acyl transferase/acyl hydrolase/lysophospholipase [Mycena latifolia]|nr:acyl transferase/acyl hydrolase/lysophospholipase [Mycena latifolia]
MSMTVPVDATSKGVRVLSLDGGGAGALSELIILDRLMYRIKTQLGLEITPHPCDYFELIGGSGTGGIIALMLGRQRMSIADVISALEKLQPQTKRGGGEAFRASKFEEVLKDIFNTERMHDPNPSHCKTFVCAMNKMNMNAVIPELFQSYNTPDEPAKDCMIWEAARATSATPGLFKPMEIGSRRMKQQYIGGSLGHNNPTALVLTEAEHIYPSHPVVLVVSIGSGHPDTIQILNAQAGAYISVSCPLQKYLDLHESAAQRIRLLNQLPSQSDYELSVYATWRISFDKVSIQAQELLQLCSFIHHDGITEAIFENAALYQFTTEGPTEVDMQEPLKFLAGLATPMSKWDSLKFLSVTTELGHYSLIDFQAGGRALTFSIHPLVHEWCRTTVNSDSSTELCMHKLLGMAISARRDVLFNHQIFPHLDVLLFKATEGPGRQPNLLDVSFSSSYLWVYEQEGKWDDGVALGNSMLPIASVGVNTVRIEGALARIYTFKGEFHRARVLGESVLEHWRTLWGEDDPETLSARANLAVTYSNLGEYKKAEELETNILKKCRTLLGEDHPDTLTSMANLAATYRELGQLKKAEELQTVVLEKCRTLLGEDHPDTLTSMASLAATYRELGHFKKAEELQTMVLDKHRKLLGEDHPDTLLAMANLAVMYGSLGQFKKAEALETVVIKKRRTLLGEDHPATLLAMANLARTYHDIGRLNDARELQEQALQKRKQILGESHPDTLQTALDLAETVQGLEEAESE